VRENSVRSRGRKEPSGVGVPAKGLSAAADPERRKDLGDGLLNKIPNEKQEEGWGIQGDRKSKKPKLSSRERGERRIGGRSSDPGCVW